MGGNARILNYEDDIECDICDQTSPCVLINTLGNDVIMICENCISMIIKQFREFREENNE